MQKEEFCIVHDTKSTQLLIDTDFDHNTDEFKLRFKFWSNEVNGFITNELTWSGSRYDDWKREFEALKDRSYAIGMVNKIFRVMFPGGVILEDEEECDHE